MMIYIIGALLVGVATAILYLVFSYVAAIYFFRKTMIRGCINQEDTLDMAETNWNLYVPRIMKDKEWLNEYPRKFVSITSDDGLLLEGALFEKENSKKLLIAFHGYTSEGQKDYIVQAKYYLENGFNVMLVDQRAHGNSAGKYVGFGVLDSEDARHWIDYAINRFGEDVEILLYGSSMGGATTLMTLDKDLPKQVKAAISDCAFTSAWNVFSHVLKTQYHLSTHPLMDFANKMTKKRAGYYLDQLDAREIVKNVDLPILFVHGDKDDFVPVSMVYELEKNHIGPHKLLVVPGAMHYESFFKDSDKYTKAIEEFIFPFFS